VIHAESFPLQGEQVCVWRRAGQRIRILLRMHNEQAQPADIVQQAAV
jgi:hypothetical protein